MSANSNRRLEPPNPTEELHIIRKLGLGPAFFCGAITPAERGARLAKVLHAKGVGHIPVWHGRDETWDDACERWYGVAPIRVDESLNFIRPDQPTTTA